MRTNEYVTGLSSTNFTNQVIVHLEEKVAGEISHRRLNMVNGKELLFLHTQTSGLNPLLPKDIAWLSDATVKPGDERLVSAIKAFVPAIEEATLPKYKQPAEPTYSKSTVPYRAGASSIQSLVASTVGTSGHTGERKSQTSADLTKAAYAFCNLKDYDLTKILTKRQKEALGKELEAALVDTSQKPVGSNFKHHTR